MTLGDMMDYMLYITNDAEMLQFYLWYCSYAQRFEALSDDEKAKSPEWHFDVNNLPPGGWPFEDVDPVFRGISDEMTELKSGVTHVSIPHDRSRRTQSTISTRTDFTSHTMSQIDEFPKPPQTAVGVPEKALVKQGTSLSSTEYTNKLSESIDSRGSTSLESGSESTSATLGVKLQGCHKPKLITLSTPPGNLPISSRSLASQPFRAEIMRITSHYLAPAAPRHLSLNHATMSSILHALEHTTHPSAFAPAIDLIDIHLRHCAHPNFVRWSICNGNYPRVFFVRSMGILHTFLGFALAVLLTLSKASRWYRLLAALLWFIGITTLVAAYKGLCIILHSEHRRTLKPWEDPVGYYGNAGIEDSEPRTSITLPRLSGSTAALSQHEGFDIFGSSNDAGNGGWKGSYERKSLWKKVFDDTVVVQDQAMRLLQDGIVRQAQLWGVLVTVVLSVVFVVLPVVGLY